MKKNVTRIEVEEKLLREHFTVVSKALYTDGGILYHSDGIETPITYEEISHVYSIDDMPIDLNLAIQCGLGVVEYGDKQYLYNSAINEGEDNESTELLRVGIYYQLTHPEYQDAVLDQTINATENSAKYIGLLLNEPLLILELQRIFSKQKGKVNNVIEFKKRV